MYPAFKLAQKYLRYYFTAHNRKGHGVHSPFVYDFIINVLRDHKKYDCYPGIEERRKLLLHDKRQIEIEDFGAGSTELPFKQRVVSQTAKISLKNKKFAQLIFRISRYYNVRNAVELGTSFGITTAYIANAVSGEVFTFEGAPSIAGIARENFSTLKLNNVDVTIGNFSKTLAVKMNQMPNPDLVFIDGNHRRDPTLGYFKMFKEVIDEQAIMIFDDIHWSKEMEEAWEVIKKDEMVTLTIDLFFIGVVFFRKEFKVRQHFAIQF